MKTVRPGDRVQVHYVKRFQDGSVVSSRGKTPLELTIGQDHSRLPGLGLALVGLAPGETTKLTVPPEKAYGLPNPKRILRWSNKRFPKNAKLQKGELVPVTNSSGRRRRVRILEVHDKRVVVDANHPRAGQTMKVKIRIHAICNPKQDN